MIHLNQILSITLLASILSCALARAEDPIRLREDFPVGYQYHVSTRVELSGALTTPAEKDKTDSKPLTVTGDSAIEYDERILALEKNDKVQKTARIYRRMDFQRKVGDNPQQNALRPEVRRLVVLRHKNVEVPFSPDGPLLLGEIDLVRTDVFTPALTGLLTDRPVQPGDRWIAANEAIQELTDLERIEDGQIECRFDRITPLEGRRHARVVFTGTVRGTNEDGPNRQQLDGYIYFDLESNHISYLSLKGISTLLDKTGKELGKIEGNFVLTRQAHQRSKDLTDEALKGVVLEPNDDNTLLLHENADLGFRFLYPRRWHVASVAGKQVTLDTTDGAGLLLTFETAAKTPTIADFFAEPKEWLQKEKAKILRTDPPARLQPAPRELDHFSFDVELKEQHVLLDYYLARQTSGGVTLAARLPQADQLSLRKEVERIARSVTFFNREQK